MKNKIYFGISLIIVGLSGIMIGLINKIYWIDYICWPIEFIGFELLYSGLCKIEDKFEELEKEFKRYLTNKK